MAGAMRKGFFGHLEGMRYSLAYLSAAFLVSAPLQLILKNTKGFISFSLVYGVALGIAALILIPFGGTDWKKMTVPCFKLFELKVARNAAIVAGLLLLGGMFMKDVFPPPELGSVVFTLMGFSYFKAKAHRLMFKEFYAQEEPAGADCGKTPASKGDSASAPS